MKFNLSIQILGLVTAVGMMVMTSGCGGGGGGDKNLAPVSLNNVTLTFADPDTPSIHTTYTFGTANYTSPGGDAGSYTYARTSTINQATLQLNSSFTAPLHYTLTFTSRTGGNFLDTDTSKTSTFTAP